MTEQWHRIADKRDDVDAGRFRLPSHGVERFEHHGCRCQTCRDAYRRVRRLAAMLDAELLAHPGPLTRGLVAPINAARSPELEDVEPRDWQP
jgi:predicted anti-sigma-YlaC factor YlaD